MGVKLAEGLGTGCDRNHAGGTKLTQGRSEVELHNNVTFDHKYYRAMRQRLRWQRKIPLDRNFWSDGNTAGTAGIQFPSPG